MKKKLATWEAVKNSLQRDVPVMILYVLQSEGSSPGRQGFFMTVNAKGEMAGSIGGGIMEHKLVELAKERLKATNENLRLGKGNVRKQIHSKEVGEHQSGMICSGEQTVFLYHVKKSDSGLADQIISTLKKNEPVILELSPSGIAISFSPFAGSVAYHFTSEENWIYREQLALQNHLYIIGGGHCALALSNLMAGLDFYIHVIETRKGLNTFEQNLSANEKKMLGSYTELNDKVPQGSNIYVVIMTFGYRTDDVALRAVWQKDLKYLGVLGSAKKIEKMFEEYRSGGIGEDVLQKIYAPIGIPIKSETPEEIAVSIAAEIIKVKNFT